MDVVARQHTIDDGHPQLVANLLDDLAHPQADLAMQHLEPIFRRPDDIVATVKSRVTTLAVAHSFYPRKSRRRNRRADVLEDEAALHLPRGAQNGVGPAAQIVEHDQRSLSRSTCPL